MRRCNAPPPRVPPCSQSNLSKMFSQHESEGESHDSSFVQERSFRAGGPKIDTMSSSVSSSSSLGIPPPRSSSPQPQLSQPECSPSSHSSIKALRPHKMVGNDDATVAVAVAVAVAATNKKISKSSTPKNIPLPERGKQDENGNLQHFDDCTIRLKELIQKKRFAEQQVMQQQHRSFPATITTTRDSSLQHQHFPQELIANEAAATRGTNCVNNHRDSNFPIGNVQGDANLSVSDDEPEKHQEDMVPKNGNDEGAQHEYPFGVNDP